jgi:hypothetical protein
MNCRQVQELLPLYVGRELEEKSAKLVTAHVQSCVECASSAEEYRETRRLLQQFVPPLFSEAVYAGIRRRVLREIERESTLPTLPQLVASFFRPPITWALATALLLAGSVFGFYFIANRTNDQQLTIDRTTRGQPNGRSQLQETPVSPSPSSKEGDGPPVARIARNTGTDTTIAWSVHRTHQSQQRKSLRAAADRTRPGVVNTPTAQSMTARAFPQGDNMEETNAVHVNDSANSAKPLRVEMQTKDPNIRIIWFSHRLTKQGSPRSKGI